ncbi:uncharacterized protein LOC124155292 [Ischnura elegans]|uniref:uncharacterized protein LOC124155292 n=1 Tax=Ischnura elegans TaxID=197161 RepID=UPI001ED894F4|nr:uncharacterized protein LOC124155292 [Ischnura elegans]
MRRKTSSEVSCIASLLGEAFRPLRLESVSRRAREVFGSIKLRGKEASLCTVSSRTALEESSPHGSSCRLRLNAFIDARPRFHPCASQEKKNKISSYYWLTHCGKKPRPGRKIPYRPNHRSFPYLHEPINSSSNNCVEMLTRIHQSLDFKPAAHVGGLQLLVLRPATKSNTAVNSVSTCWLRSGIYRHLLQRTCFEPPKDCR